jgi:hypothetical protein
MVLFTEAAAVYGAQDTWPKTFEHHPMFDAAAPEDCCAAPDYRSAIKSRLSGYLTILVSGRNMAKSLTLCPKRRFAGVSVIDGAPAKQAYGF